MTYTHNHQHHTHTHWHCLHPSIVYCYTCQVRYCTSCKREWGMRVVPQITWGGAPVFRNCAH